MTDKDSKIQMMIDELLQSTEMIIEKHGFQILKEIQIESMENNSGLEIILDYEPYKEMTITNY